MGFYRKHYTAKSAKGQETVMKKRSTIGRKSSEREKLPTLPTVDLLFGTISKRACIQKNR
jgi:hypothetical protein